MKNSLLDDTVDGLGPHYDQIRGQVDIIRCWNDGSYAIAGRLYKNLSTAMEYALDKYDFDIVLRIDIGQMRSRRVHRRVGRCKIGVDRIRRLAQAAIAGA
jgi:hypothetical protein